MDVDTARSELRAAHEDEQVLRAKLAAAEVRAEELRRRLDIAEEALRVTTIRADEQEQRTEKAEALLRQWQQDHAVAARDDERWRGSYDVLMATEKYFTALRGEEAQP